MGAKIRVTLNYRRHGTIDRAQKTGKATTPHQTFFPLQRGGEARKESAHHRFDDSLNSTSPLTRHKEREKRPH